jgi:predicted GIY-YIG superfamily endonuclease
VYVVELDRTASPDDSAMPPVYVGMTGLAPEARLANHKRGHKASRVVRKHGVRLLSSLYAHLNPMAYAEALRAEAALADRLRERGHVVFGGH